MVVLCCVQIKEVLRLTPRKRQTLLFSATMTDEVKDLATLSLQRPVRLAADAAGAAPKTLQQEIIKLKVRAQDSGFIPCSAEPALIAELINHRGERSSNSTASCDGCNLASRRPFPESKLAI